MYIIWCYQLQKGFERIANDRTKHKIVHSRADMKKGPKLQKLAFWGFEKIAICVISTVSKKNLIAPEYIPVGKVWRPAKSCNRACNAFWPFFVKIWHIFDQKIASSYLGVSDRNFTIWQEKEEPAVK